MNKLAQYRDFLRAKAVLAPERGFAVMDEEINPILNPHQRRTVQWLDVWDDITRMQTMNAAQSAKGREMHLCPMQFDIADRAIEQYTNEGEVVYDPFGGLMTTPVRALKLRRRGRAAELNAGYFGDGCAYLRMTEMDMSTPTLFDLLAIEDEKEREVA